MATLLSYWKIFHSFTVLALEIFFNTRKEIFICALPCNILYVHSPKYWSINPLAAPAPAVAALAPTWSPFSSGFMAGNFCCSIRTICVQHSFASWHIIDRDKLIELYYSSNLWSVFIPLIEISVLPPAHLSLKDQHNSKESGYHTYMYMHAWLTTICLLLVWLHWMQFSIDLHLL